MKSNIFILAFFISSFLFGQKKLSKADVMVDLDYLYKAIKWQHAAPFKYHSEKQFDSLKLAIENALPNEMTRIEAFFKLRTFIAFACDAHLQALNTPADKDQRVLSARFELIRNNLYLMDNAKDSTLNGSQILTINRMPTSQFLDAYAKVVSSDAYNVSFKYEVAVFKMNQVLKVFYGFKDSVRFDLLNKQGNKSILTIGFDSINLLRSIVKPTTTTIFKKNETLTLIKDKDSNTVLTLSAFQDRKYKNFYEKTFTYLEENKTDTLFIDLRNNTGGNFYHAYHLLNYICADTLALTFSRRMHLGSRYFKGFQKGWRLFQFFHREVSNGGIIEKKNGFKYNTNYFYPIAKHHFKGKVVVLANGLSMSSSTIVAYYLKHKADAIIVGEPGGGEFGNCGGAYSKVKLPHTKMKINFPAYWMDYHLK
jgi:Peptidase family S41